MKALFSDKSPDSEDIEITEQLLVAVNDLLKRFYALPKSPALRQCVNALLFTRTLIKPCSKCRTFSKLVQSFQPSRLDALCDDCFVSTPAIERTRKCSIGERRKLKEKQEIEAQKRADLVTQAQAAKKALADKRAKDKKASTTKSRKKTVVGGNLLALDFGESSTADVEEEKARDAILAHDARRANIVEAEDRTIFDEDYDKGYND